MPTALAKRPSDGSALNEVDQPVCKMLRWELRVVSASELCMCIACSPRIDISGANLAAALFSVIDSSLVHLQFAAMLGVHNLK